jgi:hypothetical protein
MCLKSKIRPNANMYNLLLKCATECSLNKLTQPDKPNLNSLSRINFNYSKNLFPTNSNEYQTFYDNSILNKEEQERFQGETEKLRRSEYQKIVKENNPNSNENDEAMPEERFNKEIGHQKSAEVFQSGQEALQIRPENVHVIEDIKLIGKALESKLKDLEWWQDIEKNIDKADILSDVAKHNPQLKNKLAVEQYQSLLTRKIDLEVEIFSKLQDFADNKIDRFNLIGGVDGFLTSMLKHRAFPEARTFNMMIQVSGSYYLDFSLRLL